MNNEGDSTDEVGGTSDGEGLGTPRGDTLAMMDYAKKKASHFNKHRGCSDRHGGLTIACQDCFILDAIERLESLLRPKPKKPKSLIIQ